MITIFAAPKPFTPPFDRLQTNAIGSWLRLADDVQVVLCGREEGLEEAVNRFGVEWVPEVARNNFGTPLLNDLFAQVEGLARHPVCAYVNADIILMPDFAQSVGHLQRQQQQFLMVGQCRNLEVAETVDYDNPQWEQQLRQRAARQGCWRGIQAIDYFAFTKGLYPDMPPFAVGRVGFDNWLVWSPRHRRLCVADATGAVLAIHQNHHYGHVSGGFAWTRSGDEARQNLALTGGIDHLYYISDASHRLTGGGRLKPNPAAWGRIGYRWWWLKTWARPRIAARWDRLCRLVGYRREQQQP